MNDLFELRELSINMDPLDYQTIIQVRDYYIYSHFQPQ